MSSIVFEGNTYTFGATVSANPGTGTTSYIFGGLSSGWTYGFIIWAFNGVGPSSIVGPINYSTLVENPIEQRDVIPALALNWPAYKNFQSVNVFRNGDPNSINLLPDSQNLFTGTIAEGRYYTPIGNHNPISNKQGFTAPDGTTTAHEIVAQAAIGFMLGLDVILDPGYTYYISYFHDLGKGAGTTGMRAPQAYYPFTSPLTTLNMRQILPVQGTISYGGNALYPSGPTAPTGWTRFAYEFYSSPSITGNRTLNIGLLGPIAGRTGYFWGPQLERAT